MSSGTLKNANILFDWNINLMIIKVFSIHLQSQSVLMTILITVTTG